MPVIACLHTADSNVAVFDAALTQLDLGAEVTLRHAVRADLLLDSEAAGGMTPEISARAGEALLKLTDGADVVMLTCSTIGRAVDGVADRSPVPMLRVDAALAEAAVAAGGKVVALCAVETTVGPTRALFEAAAAKTGADVEVRLVPDAWAAFRAGDRDRYLDLVAVAADQALRDGARQVALAQASMAGAATRATLSPKPLASPTAGLAAALIQKP
jgi:hypothetical protein